MSGSFDSGPVRLVRHGPVGVLTLARPEANNAIDRAARAALTAALDAAEADAALRCLVVTGAGEDAFSVGLDLGELLALPEDDIRTLAADGVHLARRMAAFSKPSLAAVKGVCFGAGFELALHCDLRLARNDARFALSGIAVGLPPGAAAVARIRALIGEAGARALALTGGVISAERAFMLGLVGNIADGAHFDEATGQIAAHLAGLPAGAVRATKALLSSDGGPEASADALAACLSDQETLMRLRLMLGGSDDTTLH